LLALIVFTVHMCCADSEAGFRLWTHRVHILQPRDTSQQPKGGLCDVMTYCLWRIIFKLASLLQVLGTTLRCLLAAEMKWPYSPC